MGTPNSGQMQGFGDSGAPPAPPGSNPIMNAASMALTKLGLPGLPSSLQPSKMSKMGGAQDPNKWGLPSLAGVPTAGGPTGPGFNAAMDPAAKQAMLAQMISRARAGGVAPTPTGTMTPPPAANGGPVIK